MNARNIKGWTVWAALCVAALSPAILAQATTATISGSVQDETGAVLPGVTVVVKNLDTGITRTVSADEQGRYSAPHLALGNYEVQAELAGFQTGIRSGIKLTVGREAIVNFTLKIGEITEKVTVTGEAPLVDITTSALSGLVDDKKIRDLPLNARGYVQLALLEPEVLAGPGEVARGQRGFGLQFTVAGAKPGQNRYLIDGTELQNEYGTAPGGVTGAALGVETLREFRVLTNTYSAEFGKASGGVINAVTRAGTNEFHGTAFYFHRNDNLDARNFFDEGDSPPEFKRNQFGAVVDGPIVRNNTFFLGSYEGLREGLGQTLIGNVPNALAREGFLPDPRTGQLQLVGVDPRVRPYLGIWPLPNGRDFGNGVAEFLSSPTRVTGQDFLTARVDHQLSSSDSFFVRYLFERSEQNSPNDLRIIENIDRTRTHVATIEETKVLSPRLLNLFRFGFSRTQLGEFFNPLIPQLTDPSLVLVSGRPLGTLGIPGVSGVNVSAPEVNTTNLFEWVDTLTYTQGAHSLKAGVEIKRFQFNNFGTGSGRVFGRWRIDSLEDFLRARGRSVEVEVEGIPAVWWRSSYLGFFVQDDVRMKPNFTLNLGLRYEFSTTPTERRGQSTSLKDFLTATQATVGPPFDNPSLRNFAPRIGFAWDPSGNGKTAVRAGFGIFYDTLSIGNFFRSSPNPPFGFSIRFDRPNFFPRIPPELVVPPTTAGIISLNIVDFEIDQPTRLRWSVGLQREMITDTVVGISYTGAHGYHQIRLFEEANTALPQILADGRKFFPAGSSRRNPNFTNIRTRRTSGDAFYQSIQFSLNKRFSQGVTFQGSYSISKTIDNGMQEGSRDVANFAHVTDVDDPKADRSLSEIDVRQNFVFNYAYDLPIGPGGRVGNALTGFAGKLLGGWQVGGILTLATGHPFTPILGFDRAGAFARSGGDGQRPDLAPGRSNNPRLGSPDQWFDPFAFELPPAGFYGNLGRNTVTGPPTRNFDLSLVKNTAISEAVRAQFRVEFFNLTNHPNFAVPNQENRAVFDRRGRLGSAGRITDTKLTSRQIQFGLKLTF